jgi:hypothetical protein
VLHSGIRGGRAFNVGWNSLHVAGEATWLTGIWRYADSNRFHAACDLLLLAYGESAEPTVPHNRVLALESLTGGWSERWLGLPHFRTSSGS